MMDPTSDRRYGPIVNWRKWGLGFSVELDAPSFVRLWIGPVRVGWKWGRD